MKAFEQWLLSVQANQNLSLYSNQDGFQLGALSNCLSFLRQAVPNSQDESRKAYVLAGRGHMHHLLILPLGRHIVSAGAKSNAGQRVKPDFWPTAASLPDKIGAAARLDHRSLEMKGEGWWRKEANEQASPDLLFCKAGEPLGGALLSKTACLTWALSAAGAPRRGSSSRGAAPLPERKRAGPGRGVGYTHLYRS